MEHGHIAVNLLHLKQIQKKSQKKLALEMRKFNLDRRAFRIKKLPRQAFNSDNQAIERKRLYNL